MTTKLNGKILSIIMIALLFGTTIETGGSIIAYAESSTIYVLATDADFSGSTNGRFEYIGTDEYVEIPHVIKGVNVTSYKNMFLGTSVKGVKSTNKNVTNTSGMFWSSKATSLDLSSFDSSNVTDMRYMFQYSQATSLDLSNLNTSNVTDMGYMFLGSDATSLDLSNLNTSNVTNMICMFDSSQATTLDLSSFDTSNVTNMEGAFQYSQATTLDLNNLNTSKVTDMSFMFNSSQATTLDFSNFDTSNVTNMNGMFYNSQATTLDLNNLNTSKVTDMSFMFDSSQATTLDLSNFDTSNVTNMNGLFYNSQATTGYARTLEDLGKFNHTSTYRPENLTFYVKLAAENSNIIGTAKVGETLNGEELLPVAATATYQWMRADTSTGTYENISGATGKTYTLVAGDFGKYIKVEVTGTGNYTGTVRSVATVPVEAADLTSISAIEGVAKVGMTLTAGALEPTGATADYQWMRDDTSTGTYETIAGATGKTYTLVAGDVGKFIKVKAIGTGSYTGTVTSNATTAVEAAPLTSIGAIEGTAQVQEILTAGALEPAGATVTYQWMRADTADGSYTNIEDAAGNKYTLKAEDFGKFIKVKASGKDGYIATVTSEATTSVAAAPLTSIGAIEGKVQVQETLTAGALVPVGATVDYQWMRAETTDGSYTNIEGATGKTYTLVAGDVGKFIKVEVTGNNGYTGTITSNATTAVAAAPLTSIDAIEGTAQVLETLTAGALKPVRATVAYQWMRADTSTGTYENIDGANSETYTLVAGDVGKFIKVEATGKDGYTATVTSNATASVAAAPLTSIGAIKGRTIVGVTLTAGALEPAGATADYQWMKADTADGSYTNIEGATSKTYRLVGADVGKFIKVNATGKNGYTGTITSEATAAVRWPSVTSYPVTGVSLSNSSLTLNVGDTNKLTVTVSPSYATNRSVTWSSSDESVATVDAEGNVTAIGRGIATIIVTTVNGNHVASCKVLVLSEGYKLWDIPLKTKETTYSWTIKLNMPLDINSVNNSSVYVIDGNNKKYSNISLEVENKSSESYIKLKNNGEFEKNKDYFIIIEDSIRSIKGTKLKSGVIAKFIVEE